MCTSFVFTVVGISFEKTEQFDSQHVVADMAIQYDINENTTVQFSNKKD